MKTLKKKIRPNWPIAPASTAQGDSTFAYAQLSEKLRIISQSIPDPPATYRGLIVARKDSGIKSVADLKNKRFAFVGPKSMSSYVYSRAMLIEKGCVNPERYFKEMLFAGSRDNVIAAVLDGRADAGAIYDSALGVVKAKGTGSNGYIESQELIYAHVRVLNPHRLFLCSEVARIDRAASAKLMAYGRAAKLMAHRFVGPEPVNGVAISVGSHGTNRRHYYKGLLSYARRIIKLFHKLRKLDAGQKDILVAARTVCAVPQVWQALSYEQIPIEAINALVQLASFYPNPKMPLTNIMAGIARRDRKAKFDKGLQQLINNLYAKLSETGECGFTKLIAELKSRYGSPVRVETGYADCDDVQVDKDDGCIYWTNRDGHPKSRKLSALKRYYNRAAEAKKGADT